MPQTVALPTYSAVYAFGDSLSDAGNLSILTTAAGAVEPVSPPYFKQQYGPFAGNVFSNGPVWVQNISVALGLGQLSPSLAGGTDFAYGGAETGSTPQNAADTNVQSISLPAQFTQFQARVLKPSSSALYTVSIGANDLLAILANGTLTAQQQAADVNAAVANEVGFVRQLIGNGAKNLAILNVPDLGKTPDVMLGLVNGSNVASPALNAEASQLAASYNAALTSQLSPLVTSGITLNVVDEYALLDNGVANPADYGLTNTTRPVWSGNFTSASSGTLAATDPAAQNQYLFFDSLHPTETGQQATAHLAESQLIGGPVLAVTDTTTHQPLPASSQPYTGPVGALQQQYINITPDSLNITAATPNWFIHSGAGEDGIAVSSGTNVLDGGTGSNFLTGGTGSDSFYVDERVATATTWSTLVNFHATDSATLWGITQSGFQLSWSNGNGAVGATGLTLTGLATGRPEVLLTLAGFTQTDLTNGRLTVSFGTETVSGSSYMNIHANA